jgi:hypothetical protein
MGCCASSRDTPNTHSGDRPRHLAREYANEARTAANAEACRRRFEERHSELDRQSLSALERSRRSLQPDSRPINADSCFIPTDGGAAIAGCRSLAQLFRADNAESTALARSVACPDPPSVFDLLYSDCADDESCTTDTDDGTLPMHATLPEASEACCEIRGNDAATMPGLINDREDGKPCDDLLPSRNRNDSPVYSLASSTSSRRSKASSGLDTLRSKLIRPESHPTRFLPSWPHRRRNATNASR